MKIDISMLMEYYTGDSAEMDKTDLGKVRGSSAWNSETLLH